MPSAPPPPAERHRYTVAAVCIALATVVAAMASLNVALPDIARTTHASETDLEWIIDAYSLLFAALLLPGGAIGDRYGRRRALIAGLTIFGAGSAVAMTAGSATELIVLRGVLGVGAALVMPATLSTITSTVPAAERASAVSIWAAVAGGAAVVGLLATGGLLHLWSWQSVFGLNVALAATALIATVLWVPESADHGAPRLDVAGAVLAFLSLTALVFTVIEAPDAGWLSLRSLIGFTLAIGFGTAFIRWELGQDQPMLDPRIFRRRGLSAATGSISIQFFSFYGFTFVALQYLQLVRGDSPLTAAVSVLPMASTMVLTSRLAPRLAGRLSARWMCGGGLAVMAAGLAILSQLGTDTSYLLFAGGLVVLGIGMGSAMTPATSAITDSLPPAQQGVGSAMNDLSRELGGALGIAVLGSVLDAIYRGDLTIPGATPGLLRQARSSLGVAQTLGGQVALHAHSAFVSGMHVALLCGAGAALLAGVGVMVALMPSAHTESETAVYAG